MIHVLFDYVFLEIVIIVCLFLLFQWVSCAEIHGICTLINIIIAIIGVINVIITLTCYINNIGTIEDYKKRSEVYVTVYYILLGLNIIGTVVLRILIANHNHKMELLYNPYYNG